MVGASKGSARGVGRAAMAAFALLAAGLVYAPSAQAAACPSEAVGGSPVGWVEFDGKQVPIKPVTYPAGGTLAPPKSAKVAGVSKRHRPLLSKQGTTVLTWHVRYGQGCNGSLNALLDKPVGSTFTIKKRGGGTQVYQITDQTEVLKGRYQPEWFRTQGSPQLSMFTCSDLRNGKFRKTTALFAVPVDQVSA